MGITNARKRRLKTATAMTAAAAIVAIAPGFAGSPAHAAGLSLNLPSTTTITATPSNDGTKLTFVASIKVLGLPGLILTPSGTVTFTNYDGSLINKAKVNACLLTTCTATLANVPASSLPEQFGVDTVTGSWGGDLVGAPSAGTVDVAITQCNTDSCYAQVTNTTTTLTVSSDSDTGTIALSLGGPASPCGVTGGGGIGNIGVSGLDSDRMTVDLSLLNSAATAYENAKKRETSYSEGGPHDYMCYIELTPFTAYTNHGSQTFSGTTDFQPSNLGPAVKITSGAYAGQYVGLLADCYELGEDNSSPCITDQWFSSEEGTEFFTEIDAPANDPHPGGN